MLPVFLRGSHRLGGPASPGRHCVRGEAVRRERDLWRARPGQGQARRQAGQVRLAEPALHGARHPGALGHQPGVVAGAGRFGGSRGRALPARTGVLACRGGAGPGHDARGLRATSGRRLRRLDHPP